MEHSFEEQFVETVHRARAWGRAYLCDGDSKSAVIWHPKSHITVRLELRADEIWLVAGAGILGRFVAASDDSFDLEGIDSAISAVLSGKATEYFGVRGQVSDDLIPTGWMLPSGDAAGRGPRESIYAARVVGPFARGWLATADPDSSEEQED